MHPSTCCGCALCAHSGDYVSSAALSCACTASGARPQALQFWCTGRVGSSHRSTALHCTGRAGTVTEASKAGSQCPRRTPAEPSGRWRRWHTSASPAPLRSGAGMLLLVGVLSTLFQAMNSSICDPCPHRLYTFAEPRLKLRRELHGWAVTLNCWSRHHTDTYWSCLLYTSPSPRD